jgi:hypothetical protein
VTPTFAPGEKHEPLGSDLERRLAADEVAALLASGPTFALVSWET